ncbi:tetratricopeptide repeat protein [Desulfobacula toluolica]|uniref:VCBS repeat domain protein n=1 Tax=Desulfobacula toluolica (strain DSM 7467 / Tol2) TaxID=651182 RepID=K0NKV3_DESTT|nr:VCBS domain-containing protein [Desulfobacula toluolica]CCK82206.1 VCBS repeat domain protein [Desulfobacula toluolica Tol2]
MANAIILGQTQKILKKSDGIGGEGTFLIKPFFNETDMNGEDKIDSSLFEFDKGDAKNNVFSLLKSIFKDQQDVVVSALSPDDENGVPLINPANTEMLFNADGTFSLYNADFEKLAQSQLAEVVFTYTVNNGKGANQVVREVAMQVTGSNEAPVIVNQENKTVDEDASFTGQVAATDIDSDDDTGSLTYVLVDTDLPAGFTLNSDGSYVIDANMDVYQSLAAGESVDYRFSWQARDTHGALSGVDQVTITITGTNDTPVVVAHQDKAVEEDASFTGQVAATDIDSDDDTGSLTYVLVDTDLPAGFTLNSDGSYVIDANMDVYQSLAAGESVDYRFSWQARDTHGALSSVDQVTITMTGTNDTPTVAAALTSDTDENADPYTINLLEGVSDIDNGAILHARNVTEANGKDGWTINGDMLTINPDFYDKLNNGDFETLQLSWQVFDEAGASVDQSLTVNIEGITDAPSLEVITSAGDHPNEIRLEITSEPSNDERVQLTFNGLTAGAIVMDSLSNNVTSGIEDYIGTQTFTVLLPENQDATGELSITVTGFSKDTGEAIGSKIQPVELSYDVSSSTEQLAFVSLNQNMWGDFNGHIGWHDYVSLIGEAPIAWDDTDQVWRDTGADYWRSGEFDLIDVHLNSDEITGTVKQFAQDALDAAWQVFTVSSQAVDQVAEGIFNAAVIAYNIAKETFYNTATAVDQTALAVFKAAEAIYNEGKDVFYNSVDAVDQVALDAFNLAVDAYEFAQDVYEAAGYAFNTVAQGAFDIATDVIETARDVYEVIPDWAFLVKGPAWLVLQAAEGAYDLAEAAYEGAANLWADAGDAFNVVAQGIYDAAKDTYELAKDAFDDVAAATFHAIEVTYLEAEVVYDNVKQGIYDTAEAVFQKAENLYLKAEEAYDTVKQGIYDTAEAALHLAENSANEAMEAASVVDFNAELQLQSELYAQVGLKVDFELDMGSVDTDIDYQLTSQVQYNQTTDMLAITPMMTNMTDGDSVAFSTISPNATFYAALLYDVGADLELFMDGDLIIAGTTIFDISPGSDGININTTVSTNSWNDLLATIPEAYKPQFTEDIGVGELVLIDFDSTEGGPWEVPFIETLTEDILSIELDFPTVETEGVAVVLDDPSAASVMDYYDEGAFVNLDISEITDAFLNLVNAKLDFSPELKELYNLPSLADGTTLDAALSTMAQGLFETILDTLDGQSEAVPIFLLDATDETSTSLLHVNLFDFNSDHLFDPDYSYTSEIDEDTGSFGFYASYGESDPVINVNIDIDAAVAVIVNKVVEAVAAAVSGGASAGATTAIPDFNPLNIEFGIEQILEMAEVPEETREEITKYINLGVTFEAADLDASASVDFSQEFTLSIDDMSYALTLENGETKYFTANGDGDLTINNASEYDADGNGVIDYNLSIVPEAMFSNDTEIGLSLGYVLDFLKGEFAAGVKLPLGDLLGLEGDNWPDIDLPMIDIGIGPLLRIEGDLDILDVDVFESLFAINVGTNNVQDSFNIELTGIDTTTNDGVLMS